MDTPRITLRLTTSTASDEGRIFNIYTASYIDPNDPTNNVSEQAPTPEAALQNLYQTLENQGYSRESLPRPRFE